MARRKSSVEKGGEGETLAASVISIRAFAAMMDLSAEWVRLRIVEGYIPKAARGRVVLIDATRGAARYFEDQAKRTADRVEDGARTRYLTARAEEIEARNVRKLADLIERAEAVEALEIVAKAAGKQLQSILAAMPPEVRGKADDAIADATERVAERFEEMRDALTTGDFTPYLWSRLPCRDRLQHRTRPPAPQAGLGRPARARRWTSVSVGSKAVCGTVWRRCSPRSISET